jgi:hypothetical protein
MLVVARRRRGWGASMAAWLFPLLVFGWLAWLGHTGVTRGLSGFQEAWQRIEPNAVATSQAGAGDRFHAPKTPGAFERMSAAWQGAGATVPEGGAGPDAARP